ELVSQGPLGLRGGKVEAGDEALAGFFVGDRLGDGIEGKKRIAGKIHLGDQPGGKCRSQQREMNVGGPPGVGMVSPGISARFDSDEFVEAIGIGEGASCSSEVGIERSWMVVVDVQIASGGIGLPDFNQGVGNGTSIVVQ